MFFFFWKVPNYSLAARFITATFIGAVNNTYSIALLNINRLTMNVTKAISVYFVSAELYPGH